MHKFDWSTGLDIEPDARLKVLAKEMFDDVQRDSHRTEFAHPGTQYLGASGRETRAGTGYRRYQLHNSSVHQ